MNNRLFIIHSSEIIQQGLYNLIKSQFDIETGILDSPKGLKNYASILNARIILLVDGQLKQDIVSKSIESIDKSNSIKIILVRDRMDKTKCKDECDCCFTLMDSKTKIYSLLEPYLFDDKSNSDKKNSTSLTEREIEVIKLVAYGKTNKEIADELYISFHTVISHRKNITEKLSIKSISGLTVYAILNNLIDASSINLD